MRTFLLAATVVVLMSATALAQEPVSTDFEIALTIESSACTIAVADVDMGSFPDFELSTGRVDFDVTITCPSLRPGVLVGMDYGLHDDGRGGARQATAAGRGARRVKSLHPVLDSCLRSVGFPPLG